jgi:preprotein translocase subunit SecY
MASQSALPDVPLAAASSAKPAPPVPPARRGLAVRLAFALGCLAVYRLGTYIPVPGIDAGALARMQVSGGLHSQVSILSFGLVPYITASLFMQMVIWGWPGVAALMDTRPGRVRINGAIRVLTVGLAAVQAFVLAFALNQGHMLDRSGAVLDAGWLVQASITATVTAGAMFVLWLSERITARGVSDGVLVILLADTLADMPVMLARAFEGARIGHLHADEMWPPAVLLVFLTAVMVFFESARRRLPVQNPARPGETLYLPLKLNGSGVLALYLAPGLLSLPWLYLQVFGQGPSRPWEAMAILAPGQSGFIALTALLIPLIAYTSRTNGFNPRQAAAFLKASGGFISGVGADKTAAFAGYVLARVSAAGALYLMAVYVAAELIVRRAAFAYLFSAITLLIAVLVTLDIRMAAGKGGHADEHTP